MEIRQTSFNFPPLRGSGPRTAAESLIFPRNVRTAAAGLTGYSVGFAGDDHEVGLIQVDTVAEITANVVTVRATFGLRDWSGHWDDEYVGTILVAVLAELEDATAPVARGDLAITGLEYNQATQFFRSATHLDAATAMPDNSMPLIGGKPTGIRVYVDYDRLSGLPTIFTLSGELVVRTGAATLPLMPTALIFPRRDAEIDRGTAGHTLNFMIPGAWCRGTIEIECRVFDSTSPAQSSAIARRTLRFLDVNPLRVFGVGVHYTGQGLDLPAPTATDMLTTLGFTRKTFPTGDVLLSGFTTIDFSEDLRTPDTDDCGDGFSSLKDELEDLRGDSDDLYYGLLPTGVLFGAVAGCGGNGVGTGKIGDQVTAAHEAGHALGRDHAPCDSTSRCDDPSDQDDDYPQYGLYPSDSIGEFGYDPALDLVFDPAATFDFMGYSSADWISPYTYRALLARMDPPAFAFAAAAIVDRAAYRPIRSMTAKAGSRPSRAEWNRIKINYLFLHLDVDRDRCVTLHPAFTFPAYPRLNHRRKPGFSVEVRDGDGREIACAPLESGCMTCRPECWPRHLRAEIPIDPKRARRLVVFEGDAEIHAVDLPDPPKLDPKGPEDRDDGSTLLRWECHDPGDSLYYLVHWQDEDGTWRGVAPRQQSTELAIPARYRLGRAGRRIRILATNGLATAIATLALKGLRGDPPIRIVHTAADPSPIVTAWAIDHLGRTLSNAGIHWHDDRGAELGRGPDLDTRTLTGGSRLVRAVALNAGAGKAEAELVVTGRARAPLPPWRLPKATCPPDRYPNKKAR